jgi:hypothetical protein
LLVLILVKASGKIRMCTVAGRRDRQSTGGVFDSPNIVAEAAQLYERATEVKALVRQRIGGPIVERQMIQNNKGSRTGAAEVLRTGRAEGKTARLRDVAPPGARPGACTPCMACEMTLGGLAQVP